ncbi:LysR family transcriptional regulator [Cribrihabitans pelagius]|uniref:LysR family transcriptional regulator n=1 Tax=Cribrihabitans pelagius TaxID=1765746 RepID=UPI003B5A472B
MDIQQLKTFVTVAREGSITRASELLFRSQPAVSAHIKCMEETLGLTLFQRTPRGMTVTENGQRLLSEARQLLDKHQRFLEEASRLRGCLAGQLCLGAGRHSGTEVVSSLLTAMSRQFPDVKVELQNQSSSDVLEGIRRGTIDAGFFTETGEDLSGFSTLEISSFCVYLAAPAGLLPAGEETDWAALEDLPWIFPASSSCCGRLARELLESHGLNPRRIIHVDDEMVTRTLIASGAGVGLVHSGRDAAQTADGGLVLLRELRQSARVLFAHLTCRQQDPVIAAVRAILAARPGAGAAGAEQAA